jgi:pimeloyl-ACP methyl ester carboxylesterase
MAESFIKSGVLDIWTEQCGDPQNPPVLLIMGFGSQGIFWPDVFFHGLANEGFFVIRYDHRDVGKSSTVDFGADPYTIDDLIKDAIAVLDAYNITQAHIIGTSLGGFMALRLALSFGKRVRSLTLLMTSSDLSVVIDAITGIEMHTHTLPPPTQGYVALMRSLIFDPPKTKQEVMDMQINMWQFLSGPHDFDEKYVRALVERAINRMQKYDSAINHAFAIGASRARIDNLADIKVPTLVMHGKYDPIFPIEHGKKLAHSIAYAEFINLPGVGHIASEKIFKQEILPAVVNFLKKQ